MNNVLPLYAPFYEGYIQRVKGSNLLQVLHDQIDDIRSIATLSPEKADFAYAPGKWTIKELMCHATDTERIMSYRLLCLARGEHKDLPGFDENAYMEHAGIASRSLSSIVEEFIHLREANIYLAKSLSTEQLAKVGTANGSQVNVSGLLHILAGHWAHHYSILKERYGI
ncbi:DinB family protein [Cytophagales bacterium LB-30]|uniref:DinB family protein n=1 Tax=Shiella aurantiaca TaxID=3058365 RepID=A0ABT8F109_9BACT|nr:DinB family protein [Shiella aurantiaca]MDN4164130.1 DinB family protein [Shiella aurantiaca]